MATTEEKDTRPDWVKQVQADAERLTNKRLEEDAAEQERLEATEQAQFVAHPVPAEQKLATSVKVAERSEPVLEKVSKDSAVNAESVAELKKKV